jgi:alkanesulfonate monooxygenase SsuD/methylene tetrahydromethanopterin reductase-like flavin-dependent oxidoreductase (luciferase family)
LAADAAGLEELWLWEDCFRESRIATGAAVLAWTGRLRVGVGLLPAPLRNVALTAMEVATLERLFPGRLRLGVGHGVQEWMGQVGARVDSPMTLLREYLAALRSSLAGERVSAEGRYVRLTDVALDWPPAALPSLLVGAVGPRTLELSGELAAGTIAGRTDPPQVTVYLLAATGPGAAGRVLAESRGWNGATPGRPRSPAMPRRSPAWSPAGPPPAPTPWCCSRPPTNPTRKALSASSAARYARCSRLTGQNLLTDLGDQEVRVAGSGAGRGPWLARRHRS